MTYPSIQIIPLDSLDGWSLSNSLDLTHHTGGFFRYKATRCIDNCSSEGELRILQNEIGLLLSFVDLCVDEPLKSKVSVQKKFEPGNNPLYQLSPTIQKTFSNLRGLHGGSAFNVSQVIKKLDNSLPISATLQTEQSDSYLHKKNLNVLISHESQFLPSDYIDLTWIEISTICDLLLQDRQIHIDLRSVLFPLLLKLFLDQHLDNHKNPNIDIAGEISELHFRLSLFAIQKQNPWLYVPIDKICEYVNGKIILTSSPDTQIIGVSVVAQDREVFSWAQPLLVVASKYFTLITALHNGEYYVLTSFHISTGSMNEPELMPSFVGEKEFRQSWRSTIPCSNINVIHKSVQTEEGGRFWNRSNHYEIILSDYFDPPTNCAWVSLTSIGQIYTASTLVSIELRSACILLLAHLLTE